MRPTVLPLLLAIAIVIGFYWTDVPADPDSDEQTVVASRVGPPSQIIVHIKDWRFVSRSRFDADLRESLGLSDLELDQAYEAHLQAVEAVQRDQLAILRQLMAEQEFTAVYCEAWTRDSCLSSRSW